MTALLPNVDPDGLLEFSVVFTDRSLNHMSTDFQSVMCDISKMLTSVYNTDTCAIVPGGGTFAMESVAREFATYKKVMVLRNGWFSFRWSQIFETGDIPSEVVILKAKREGDHTQSAFRPQPIEDVVDVIKEEADKDYQLAAGLTQDVEADDSILQLTKARLPWLFLGLLGGVGAFLIMVMFENTFDENAVLFFFTPLIAAMAGNVGVQSSAIIVQGLANDDVKGSINSRLIKEMLLAALNGLVLAVFLFGFVWFYEGKVNTALAISVSLVAVIIVAGLIGTFVPLFLNKRGIDPAIATGPFITTSNDIFGILIYFMIAKLILGI